MLKFNKLVVSRRRMLSLLGACVAAASTPRLSWALGQRSQFGIAEIQLSNREVEHWLGREHCLKCKAVHQLKSMRKYQG